MRNKSQHDPKDTQNLSRQGTGSAGFLYLMSLQILVKGFGMVLGGFEGVLEQLEGGLRWFQGLLEWFGDGFGGV
eukprot:12403789-Karenia_brevis.AAC.1